MVGFSSMWKRVLPAMLALGLSGCFVPNGGKDLSNPGDGPGSEPWGSSHVDCNNDNDCLSYEACQQHVCQMKRCQNGPYVSAPPLGRQHFFFYDRELAAMDTSTYQGDYWIDGYEDNGSASYKQSVNVGASQPTDISAGAFFGTRPEINVVSYSGSSTVAIESNPVTSVDLGFTPVAIAAGDSDGDGVDEIFALAQDGSVHVCTAQGYCNSWSFGNGYTGKDIAAGDVDGDGLDEPIALITDGTYDYLIAINAKLYTGEVVSWGAGTNQSLSRIAATDMDGDGADEVIGLHTGGGDSAVVYSMLNGSLSQVGSLAIGSGSLDIAASKLHVDDTQGRAIVLQSPNTVLVLKGGQPSVEWSGTLSASTTPKRITAQDIDGDSPAGTLTDTQTVAGPMVPTFVVHFPPYYRYRSAGLLSSVGFGDSTSTSYDYNDTIALHANIDVGVSVGIQNVFSAKLDGNITKTVTRSHDTVDTLYEGVRYSLSPNPQTFGDHYGGIAVAYACFNTYTYSVEDPANLIGASGGGKFTMFVPVDGSSTIWSSTRWNSLAQKLGNLPTIDFPETVGDPASYPTVLKQDNGQAITAGDLVFTNPPKETVSDVGYTGFALTVSHNDVDNESLATDVTLNGSFSALGLSFSAGLGQMWGQGLTINIGHDATFYGSIPPLPDDPSTPGDEYAEYAYSFAPQVYRQHYTLPDGSDSSYYVLNFTSGLLNQ